MGGKDHHMTEYLKPGAYGEEVAFRSKSIEGVSTSRTRFVGWIQGRLEAIVKIAVVVGLGGGARTLGLPLALVAWRSSRARVSLPPKSGS
jgi:hypothetical protein